MLDPIYHRTLKCQSLMFWYVYIYGCAAAALIDVNHKSGPRTLVFQIYII